MTDRETTIRDIIPDDVFRLPGSRRRWRVMNDQCCGDHAIMRRNSVQAMALDLPDVAAPSRLDSVRQYDTEHFPYGLVVEAVK